MIENRKQILLVEDEALIAMDKQRRIEKMGYGCTAVHTGEAAIAAVRDTPDGIDLILMDIDLGPGIDGTEAAQQILAQVELPIVFMSSHTDLETIRKTEGITSYGYVVKLSHDVAIDASIKMALKLFRANTATRREKRNLEHIFDGSPLGILVINHEYEVVRVNSATEEISGRRLTDFSKPRCGDFLGCSHRHDQPRRCGETESCADCAVFRDIKEALFHHKLSGAREAEFQVDGEVTKWFRYTTSPISLDGHPAAVVAIADVTRQRSAYALVRQLSRVAESDNTLMVITDPQRRTTWANRAFEKLSGYTVEELYGRNPGELLQGPNPDQELRRQMTAAFDAHKPFQTEIRNFSKDGTPYWIFMDVQPLFDDHGELEGFISIQRDVSGEKRHVQELEERDRRLWLSMNDFDDAVTVIDGDGRPVFVNEAFARQAGFSTEEILKMEAAEIMEFIHPDDRGAMESGINQALQQQRSMVSSRYRTRQSDGRYVWRQDRIRYFYHGDGALDQVWITGHVLPKDDTRGFDCTVIQ
ncbi:MAG: PAS domain S-box protein [Spirochaeta sp.]|jgi:PAS domain S-box-containing protein|nr:PAS domain S-box protein [Spirochaeta sp.]